MCKQNKEIWRVIKDYEGLYEVSNLGRVRSLDRLVSSRNRYGCYKMHVKERILRLGEKVGYQYCELCKNGLYRSYRLQRIVATAFLANPTGKTDVNHIHGDKLNNKVDNLEWTTHKKNMIDAFKNDLIKPLKGKNHPKARSVLQINESGNIIKKFDCIADAARKLGIFHGNISYACKGKLLTTGGFRWKYA